MASDGSSFPANKLWGTDGSQANTFEIKRLVIGAKDVAFPRLNMVSFYLWILGALLTVIAILANGVDTGWTFYTPYSIESQSSVIWMGLGIFVLVLKLAGDGDYFSIHELAHAPLERALKFIEPVVHSFPFRAR